MVLFMCYGSTRKTIAKSWARVQQNLNFDFPSINLQVLKAYINITKLFIKLILTLQRSLVCVCCLHQIPHRSAVGSTE